MHLVFLYYDNPGMLARQLACWSSYAGVLDPVPEILLVDDGSPRTRAVDTVRQVGCGIPIKVFRIKEDIPCNFAGARNLGCHHAEGWIYVSDIDTLLYAEDAKNFFQAYPLDQRCFYQPRWTLLPELTEGPPGMVNLLFHKEMYEAVGGYDEDYAGRYGKEEVDFYRRLIRRAPKVYRKSVLIRVMPPALVADANTRGLVRDKSHNAGLFAQKEAAGFPRPAHPLRFSWERVL
jgi:hypothetical protein